MNAIQTLSSGIKHLRAHLVAAHSQQRFSTWMEPHIKYFLDTLLKTTSSFML